MKVIRMQNADGRGPYIWKFKYSYGEFGYSRVWATRSHCSDRHPSLWGDAVLKQLAFENKIPRGVRFGFKTMEQALEWFNCDIELERLKDHGFEFHVVEAKQVWHGDKQSVFVPLDNS